MVPKDHPLFDQSIEFLKNGGDIPTPSNANDRFKTTAVLLREIYGVACKNEDRSRENEKKAGENRLWLTIFSGSSGIGIIFLLLKTFNVL